MPRWGRLERLRPHQIEAILAETPIAYIPWGAIEWHGVHNPAGLDGLKALSILQSLARETGGVVLPPIYFGTDTIKPYKGFHHTLDYPRELVQGLARQTMLQLVDEGYRVIVLLSGHYAADHTLALRQATEAVQLEWPQHRFWFTSDCYLLEGRYDANHAAWGETSFQLWFEPELVDLSLLPQDRPANLDQDGVSGMDPRQANAAGGRDQTQALIEVAAPRVRSLLEEATRSGAM